MLVFRIKTSVHLNIAVAQAIHYLQSSISGPSICQSVLKKWCYLNLCVFCSQETATLLYFCCLLYRIIRNSTQFRKLGIYKWLPLLTLASENQCGI